MKYLALPTFLVIFGFQVVSIWFGLSMINYGMSEQNKTLLEIIQISPILSLFLLFLILNCFSAVFSVVWLFKVIKEKESRLFFYLSILPLIVVTIYYLIFTIIDLY